MFDFFLGVGVIAGNVDGVMCFMRVFYNKSPRFVKGGGTRSFQPIIALEHWKG